MRRCGLETWLVDFNSGKTQLVLFDQSHDTGANDVKMNGSVLEEKLSFKKLELTFCSEFDWGSCNLYWENCVQENWSIDWFYEVSNEVALYLYKSTISPCIECCCHVQAGTSSCHLELLDKLQKRIC